MEFTSEEIDFLTKVKAVQKNYGTPNNCDDEREAIEIALNGLDKIPLASLRMLRQEGDK